MFKKYRNDIILLAIIFVLMYLLPIVTYYTDNSTSYYTYMFTVNNLAIFAACLIHARYGRLFFVFPIIYALLFIPLAFAIYGSVYLCCSLLYLVVGMIGALLGLWLSDKADALKATKKGVGISAVIFSIFTIIISIVDKLSYCANIKYSYCNVSYQLTIGNIDAYLCAAALIALSIRCLKKKVKKSAK